MRAALGRRPDGVLTAEVGANQDSSLVSVLASAGGLVQRLAGAPSAEPGETVDVMLLDREGV